MYAANKQHAALTLQIIPVFLDHLPIEVDHDEDPIVYGCLATFLKEADVKNDIKWVAKGANIFAQALVNNETSKGFMLILSLYFDHTLKFISISFRSLSIFLM